MFKKQATHTHSHTLAVLCSILSACVWVYVCVHGHLKEIWISEFKKRWRQAGSKHSNNKNNNGAEKKGRRWEEPTKIAAHAKAKDTFHEMQFRTCKLLWLHVPASVGQFGRFQAGN